METADRLIGDLPGRTRTISVPGPPKSECPACTDEYRHFGPYRLHVTVNFKDGQPFEVFAAYSPPGPEGQRGTLNAACRLASRLLQTGAGIAEVVKMMRGQADGWPPVRLRGGDKIVSAADGIARVLQDVGNASAWTRRT